MKSCFRTISLLIAVLAFAIACAHAVTATVTPENMRGWSIETNKGGFGGLTNFGPCVYEHKGFVSEGGGTSFGNGAFYAENNYAGSSYQPGDHTPSSVWLGTDQQNGRSLVGVTLNQIKTMNYYSYVAETPVRSDSTGWRDYTYWRGPHMMIMLQITAESPDGSDRKQFWLRPRSFGAIKVQGCDGGMDPVRNGQWQYLDAYTERWYYPPDRDDLSDEADWPNWPALCAVYGNYKLVATSTSGILKSAGWHNLSDPEGLHYSTATGKCLNFETGARFWKEKIFYSTASQRNWYMDGLGLRGHVDRFTLGVDFNSDGDDYDSGEQVTYNFEPSATAQSPTIKFASIKSLNNNPLVDTQLTTSPHGFAADQITQSLMMHKVFGRVAARPGKSLALEDGSALNVFLDANSEQYNESIRSYWPLRTEIPAGAWIGSYWSGWGFVERLRGFNYDEVPPLMLWTDPTHMKQYWE